MTTTTDFVPLNQLGPIATHALRVLRERDGLNLPKPSRIKVKITRNGKFTTAIVKSGTRIESGVAARNPDDRDVAIKGAMTALVRALRHIGQ